MGQEIIQLDGDVIGVGQERACYEHPQDHRKVIKIQRGEQNTQTRRELRLYHWLQKRNLSNYDHIPRYYGRIETNRGQGFIVDLIDDYDGHVSRSLYWFFQHGYPLSEFYPYLEELKRYLLDNRIVFSVDMGRFNVLFRRESPEHGRLVIIDGLGNHTLINWLDNIDFFAHRKINRRWNRFFSRLQKYSEEMMLAFDGKPRKLKELNEHLKRERESE